MMNEQTFLQILSTAWQTELAHIPMLLLQATGIMGIVSTLLIFRGRSSLSERHSCVLGIVFGGASFLLAALVEQWIQEPSKPYLRNDLLFLAGFFGGWLNASITILFTALGRVFFGGFENSIGAIVDIAIIGYSGVYIRSLTKKISINKINLSCLFYINTIRMLINFPALFIINIINPITINLATSIIIRRFFSLFFISIIIMYVIILLLRREIARDDQLYIDNTTGLPNYRSLKKHIDNYFNENKTNSKMVCILISNNNAQEIIQEHGHEWFENFSRNLGKKLSDLCLSEPYLHDRPSIYAFSDHSFVLVILGISIQEEKEMGVANFFQAELRLFFDHGNISQKAQPRLSVITPEFNSTFSSSWFLQGIKLMQEGRHDAVQYFESNIIEQIKLESRLRILIEKWIVQGDIPLWLQPKMDLVGNYCLGAEALMRAVDPENKQRNISPFLVFSVAAKYQLLLNLELACIKTVLGRLQQLPASMKRLKISVNLSAPTLMNPGFGEELCSLLIDHNIEGNRLIIEITETNQLIVSPIVENNISQLLQQGVGLSLDDFGTGYSSLSLLSILPIDEVKLDYSMISNIKNPKFYSIITLSSDAARNNSAYVVAEGIETSEQIELLVKIGITEGQGFLFAKAMPFEDFVNYAQSSPPTTLIPSNACAA